MKKILLALVVGGFGSLEASAQKVPLTMQDLSKRERAFAKQYVCMRKQSDKQMARLRKAGVDTLLLIDRSYRHDIPGGRFKFQEVRNVFHLLWQQDGKVFIQDFASCEPVPPRSIHPLALDTLVSFYQKWKINTLTIPHRAWVMENPGYSFSVQVHDVKTHYFLSDSNRRSLEDSTSVTKPDARLEWLKLVERIIRK